MISIQPFSASVWRLLAESLVATPEAPANAPAGRFHHSGQVAAYASLSAEGAAVAIKRYLGDGTRRILIPMWLEAERVVDVRGQTGASIVWQDLYASGEPSPTWKYSDTARDAGAQAMLYSSRSRPDLSHVVIFEPKCLRIVGTPEGFTPERN